MRAPILLRKLLRDFAASKWQYAAIGAMVMLGVAFYNASYAAYLNLNGSYERSFNVLRFEDFSVQFHAAPKRVASRIAQVRGVQAVEGRLVEDVILELPGKVQSRKLIGRLISMPVGRELALNRLKLVEGATLGSNSRREILLEASFAQHHLLKPGAWVEAVRGSSRVRLRVAGIVQSPEYLYVVRSKQDLMASPDTFGVMFVSDEVLGPLVGKPDLINEVHGRFTAAARPDSTLRQVQAALAGYRPDDPVLRADQPSYQMLMQDVQGFRIYAVMFPAFFLSVAAVAVYTLLLRLVHQERPIIGLFRSLGFSRRTVVWHYLLGATCLGLVAGVLGGAVGLWLAHWTSMGYMSMLQVPEKEVIARGSVLAAGVGIGVLTCAVGAFFPARFASRIQPAEAMRPAAPSFGSRSLRLDFLFPRMRLLGRIPLRNLFRQPRRTLSTLFGIVAGIALMMTAKGLLDSSEIAMDELISGSYRYDMRLDFLRPQTTAALNRVRSWPGVVRAEGVLEAPVEFRHGEERYAAMLSGQGEAAALHRLTDDRGNKIVLPREGAIFGPSLRKRLQLERGDTVVVTLADQFAEENPREHRVLVAGFNNEAMGTVAYLRREALWRLMRADLELPPNALSGIVLRVRENEREEVRRRLLDLPEAASVLSVAEIRTLIETMMSTFRIFVWIMELFGVALAFAMIFNMVTVNVLERTAEIATLRTIGVSRSQIAWMVGTENLALALLGVATGLPFGRWFIGWFWLASQTEEQQELFTFNVALKPETYWMSALAILLAVALSQLPALRLLGRLDLAKATKERCT